MTNEFLNLSPGAGQHRLLHAAFDNFGLPGAICDSNGKLTHANKCMCENIQQPLAILLGSDLKRWVITEPPLDAEQLARFFTDPATLEHYLPCRLVGKPLLLTLTVIREDNQIAGYTLVTKATSITKIKNQALKEEIKDFAFICFDLQGKITAWNEGAHFIYGYSEQEARQLKQHDFYHTTDIEKGHAADLVTEASRHGRADDEGIRVRKDGSKFWASEVLTPIRDPFKNICGYMLIVRDITAQKLEQEMLERELHSFHTLLTNFPNGVVKIFDHQLCYTLVKGQRKVMLEKDANVVGKSIYELYPEYIWKQLEGPFKKALQGDTSLFELQVNDKYFLFNTMPVKNSKGDVQSGILIAQDLSAMHKADIEVAKHNNLLRAIFEGTNDVVFVKDLEGRYIMSNPAGAAYFGKTPEEVIGLTNFDLFNRKDSEMIIAMDAKLMASKETVTYVDTVVIGGKKHSFNTTKGPLFDHEGKMIGLVGISRDVTDANKTEKRLKKAERSLNEAQSLAKICSFEYLPKKQTITWSSNSCHVFGLPSKQALEQVDMRQLILVEDWPTVEKTWAQVIEGKKPQDLDYRMRLPNGNIIYLHGRNKPILNARGDVMKVRGTVQDVTQNKLAERSISQMNETLERRVKERTEALVQANAALKSKEEYFRSLIQNSSDAIQLTGRDGRLLFLSDSVEAVLGYKPEEVLGMENTSFMHPEDAPKTRMLFEQLLQHPNQPITTVHRLRHKDGNWRWIESVGNNLLDNPAIQAVVINYHDVSERVVAQEALEDRVTQRTAQLEAANKELEAFSYSVSHDLRAPLRAMVGFGQVLERDHGPHLGDEGRRILSIIMNNSQRMGHLIDDLLEFSRLGRREQNIYRFSMDMLVRDLLKEQFPNLGDKVAFSVEPLPEVVADRSMVSQVFVNLISNAVKFSKAGYNNHIKIGVSTLNDEKTFYISDEGVGFDMRYKDKLFGVFQRLHSAKDFEGTGVGLALVQRIVHRHGGRIWAESKVNAGATFYFTLPKSDLG